MKPHVIILLGPPGAGKGSQATLIKERLGLPHVATGNLLRMRIARGDPLGLQAKRYMDAGEFPPEQLVIDILLERIGSADCSKGFILDGFPRTIHQAEVIADHFKGSADIVAISLELSDSEIIERIAGRIVCMSCQAPFHLTLAPPARAGKCDTCMGTLTQRSDDSEAVAVRRLELYREQTAPLIDYYKSRGLLHPIDSNQSKEAILLQILTTMKRDKKYSHPDR